MSDCVKCNVKSKRSSTKSASKRKAPRRPFVAATFAMTVDGKITTHTFAPVDFTSREDKSHLIRQRALADAVLIGYGTLKRDNVRLSIARASLCQERIARKQSAYPLRVIVSNEGRIDPELNVFKTDPDAAGPIVIFSTTRMPRRYQKMLREKATLVLGTTRQVDLAWMLRQLRREYKVRTVACEGGAQLFRGLLERGLVDQLNVTIAPVLFGGEAAPTLTGISKEFLPASVRCSLRDMRVIGDECFLTYRIHN
ncbi:MAG: RibD family protein [Chthoniobacterales bacterium]